MTENVEDDVTMLHEEIHRLRDEIRCQAVHNASRTTLKHRRELQLELEVTLQRLAERVETKRVEEVQRHVTESGFVVNPSRIDDECPLCLETIPEWRNDAFVKLEQTSQKFLCCGKVCCEPCIIKFNKAYTPDRVRCPFCRSTQPSDDAGKDEMIARNAKAGHSFAQFALGQSFHTKWARNAEDVEAEEQTVYWLTLASEKGEIGAQYMLGFMWYSGATTTITKSNGKAMEILLPAARRGHATAQYTCGQILWEQGVRNGEELVWFTLAAAQGQAHAQERLGDIFLESTDDYDDSDNSLVEAFKGAYWTRKAALQGRRKAQSALAALVFALKEELFDGVTNHVGYSCIPEVLFWKRQLAAANAGGRSMTGWPTAYDAYTEESCVQSCACCGKKARDDTRGMAGAIAAGKASESPSVIKIKRCLQCRSVGYCSSECQKKHWKMGQKVDCLYAVALQKEYKKKYFSNIAW